MINCLKKVKNKLKNEFHKKILYNYLNYKEKIFTNKLINSCKNDNLIESDIFLFCPREVRKEDFYNQLYLIFAKILIDKGYQCSFLTKNNTFNKKFIQLFFKHEKITDSINILGPYQLKKEIEKFGLKNICNSLPANNYSWKIDFKKKIIQAEDFNFYNSIITTFRTIEKCSSYDINNEETLLLFNILINNCDCLLKIFNLLIKYTLVNNNKIKIIGWENNYIPNSIFSELCSHYNNKKLEFIDLARSYMHYFTGNSFHYYISYINCTKNKVKDRFFLTPDRIENISSIKNIDIVSIINKIKLISFNYKNNNQNIFPNKFSNKICKYKKNEKKIFILFAHVFFDSYVGGDYSDVFEIGILNWIDETIEYFINKDDLLILKPHPHEKKLAANETLCSYIKSKYSELPENIILLNSDDFTTGELIDKMTCGLIWRSSVALELTCMGVPCIIAGNPLYKGLDLIYAKNKSDYFDLIDNAHNLKVTEASKVNVCQYFYYMENLQSTEFKYCKTSKFGVIWDYKNLKEFFKNGAPELEKIVEDMIL